MTVDSVYAYRVSIEYMSDKAFILFLQGSSTHWEGIIGVEVLSVFSYEIPLLKIVYLQ